ncbi:MAG: hypothetical protein J6A29_01770 [Clostridia bacterium]|nr:hypothetical protein [Clostridia bacterium]
MKKFKNVGADASVRPTSKARQNKGITLIALIITIIVMLILVAVTITTAINGGLFEKAGEAVGDTKNSINAEQKLADGRIKIGDFWYASIDDYLNNNPIATGITVDKATLELKKKEAEEATGEEVLTGTITASVFGMDQEPEITWEVTPADQTAVTLSGTTGKTITVTAVGTVGATITITAKCTYEEKEYTAPCEVSLKIIKLANIKIGDFVEYGIEYKDVIKDYTYLTTNGWRLLNYKTNDEGKTIYDVELISTGVPAKLYYCSTSYSETGNNKWWVTDVAKIAEFKTALENHYTTDDTSEYTFKSNTGSNTYASAGMYYNLKDIPFYAESNYNALSADSEKYNIGWYRSITKGTETLAGNKVGSDIFITSPGNSVRMLTLPEINSYAGRGISEAEYTLSSTQEPSAGLFILENIKNITGLSGHSYNLGAYWLASPWVKDSSNLYYMNRTGSVSDYWSYVFGIRPVIRLRSDVLYSVQIETDSTTGMDYYTLTAE